MGGRPTTTGLLCRTPNADDSVLICPNAIKIYLWWCTNWLLLKPITQKSEKSSRTILHNSVMKLKVYLFAFAGVVSPGVSSKIYMWEKDVWVLCGETVRTPFRCTHSKCYSTVHHCEKLTIWVSSSVKTPRARDLVVCTFFDTANT